MLVLLMGGMYEVGCWYGFMWHDTLTVLDKDWYRYLWNITVFPQQFLGSNVGITDGRDVWLGCWYGFMWHWLTVFRQDWYKHLSNITVLPQQFLCSNVGITDGRDVWSMPLRWVRCHNVYTKFRKDWLRHSKVVSGDALTDIDGDSKVIS
jgi:hypothetical protein